MALEGGMEPFAPTPRTLSLITTFRCTAACASCCFGCSPWAARDVMSLRRMRHYIDTVLAAFGGSLQVVVFTGGECFFTRCKAAPSGSLREQQRPSDAGSDEWVLGR